MNFRIYGYTNEEYYAISSKQSLPLRCPILRKCRRAVWSRYVLGCRLGGDNTSFEKFVAMNGLYWSPEEMIPEIEQMSWHPSNAAFCEIENCCPEIPLFEPQYLPASFKPSAFGSATFYKESKKFEAMPKHFSECAEFSEHQFNNAAITATEKRPNKLKSSPTRKTIPQKIKMLLQREIGSTCPFCNSNEVGHFQFHHIDENPENDTIANLLMLCPTCHSKITKGDVSRAKVEAKKQEVSNQSAKKDKKMGKVINFNANVGNAVVGDNNKVTLNIKKDVKKSKYPEGCIGSVNEKANYISYLITRYHEYKEWEVGKGNMNYAIFQSGLKKKYKLGKTRTIYHVPDPKFEELAAHIQERIDGTVLANVKRSKGQRKNYATFEEYLDETQG
jgi:5-methylcytosine-specific restriction endonuclease McrA